MAIELQLLDPGVSEATLLGLSMANPGYRLGRSAEGKLSVAPSGLFSSGGELELSYQVMTFAKATKNGRAFPATGAFTLPDSSIVAPDTTYVTLERLASLSEVDLAAAYIGLVPEVVFELLSPSDSHAEAVRKIERYLTNGVSLAVLITMDSVELHRSGSAPLISFEKAIEPGPEMPGFVLDADAIRMAAKAPR